MSLFENAIELHWRDVLGPTRTFGFPVNEQVLERRVRQRLRRDAIFSLRARDLLFSAKEPLIEEQK